MTTAIPAALQPLIGWACVAIAVAFGVAIACGKFDCTASGSAQQFKRHGWRAAWVIAAGIVLIGAWTYACLQAGRPYTYFAVASLFIGQAIDAIRQRHVRREIEWRVGIAAVYIILCISAVVPKISGAVLTALGLLFALAVAAFIVRRIFHAPQPYGYFNPGPDE